MNITVYDQDKNIVGGASTFELFIDMVQSVYEEDELITLQDCIETVVSNGMSVVIE